MSASGVAKHFARHIAVGLSSCGHLYVVTCLWSLVCVSCPHMHCMMQAVYMHAPWFKSCFQMPPKGGGIWQRLGLDRSRTPKRNLVPEAPQVPPVPLVPSKGPQAVAWRQHCRNTFLHNNESTVKLQTTIQKATAAGALGSEDYAKAGNCGRGQEELVQGFQKDIYQGH